MSLLVCPGIQNSRCEELNRERVQRQPFLEHNRSVCRGTPALPPQSRWHYWAHTRDHLRQSWQTRTWRPTRRSRCRFWRHPRKAQTKSRDQGGLCSALLASKAQFWTKYRTELLRSTTRARTSQERKKAQGASKSLAWISAGLQLIPRLLVTFFGSNQEPGNVLKSGWNSG